MDTDTLVPIVAAATLASAHVSNRNLSTDPRRMAVIKVWDAIVRGARKYCEQESFVTVHNMPHIVGVTGACENTDQSGHEAGGLRVVPRLPRAARREAAFGRRRGHGPRGPVHPRPNRHPRLRTLPKLTATTSSRTFSGLPHGTPLGLAPFPCLMRSTLERGN